MLTMLMVNVKNANAKRLHILSEHILSERQAHFVIKYTVTNGLSRLIA